MPCWSDRRPIAFVWVVSTSPTLLNQRGGGTGRVAGLAEPHLDVARRLDEVEFDVTVMAEGGPDALTWGYLCQARAASSGDDVAGLQRRPPRIQGVRQPKHGGDRVSEDLGRASRDDEIAVQLQGGADVVPIDPIPVLDGGGLRTQPTSRPKSAVADHSFRSAPPGTRLPSN